MSFIKCRVWKVCPKSKIFLIRRHAFFREEYHGNKYGGNDVYAGFFINMVICQRCKYYKLRQRKKESTAEGRTSVAKMIASLRN